MNQNQGQSILSILREIKVLINKCLKNRLQENFTMPQTMVIYNLVQEGKLKISVLSKKMGLTNSTVSGIVDRLEEQGVVTRERSSTDRRVVYVDLTPEYKKKTLDMNNNLNNFLNEILADIPPEKMKEILSSLSTLKEALQKHLAGQKSE